MSIKTESGRLVYGIEYGGELHYDVQMRLMTVADNITAIEQVGGSSGMKITLVMMACAIERLGSIPKEAIPWEFLAKGLADSDFDTLRSAEHTTELQSLMRS